MHPVFFDFLDAQFGSERGPNGEPSADDILRYEYPTIEEQFAASFDDLIELEPGVEGSARLAAGRCLIVDHLVAAGFLRCDGSVEVMAIWADPEPFTGAPNDP